MSTRSKLLLRIALFSLLLFGFFLGLDLMGLAFKLFGKGFAETLVAKTSNPFVGLFIGILATSLVQSSSTTTSMVVGLIRKHVALKADINGYTKKAAKSELSADLAIVYAMAGRCLRRISSHLCNIASTVVQPFDYMRQGDENV